MRMDLNDRKESLKKISEIYTKDYCNDDELEDIIQYNMLDEQSQQDEGINRETVICQHDSDHALLLRLGFLASNWDRPRSSRNSAVYGASFPRKGTTRVTDNKAGPS